MIEYRDYAVEVTTAPAGGGYSARVSIRGRASARRPKALYFPPLALKPTAVAAADDAIKWAQAFIDENP